MVRARALAIIRKEAEAAIEAHPLGKALAEVARLKSQNALIKEMYDERLEIEQGLREEIELLTRQRDLAWQRINEGLIEHRRNLRAEVIKTILVHIEDIREWKKWLR